MENTSGIVKRYKQNFLLDETKLRKIVDVLREQSKKLAYETYIEFWVERENNFYFTTRELDVILQDDNTVGKSIRNLIIELYKSEPDPYDKQRPPEERKALAYIAFSPDRDTKVQISVTSEDRDWTSLTIDEIDTQIMRTLLKKGISALFRYADFIIAPLVIFVGMILGSWLLQASSTSGITQADIASMTPNEQIAKILGILVGRGQNTSFSFILCWLVAWGIGMIIFATRPISHLIGKSRASFFYWGDMIQLHKKLENRNTLLIWFVGIALLVSIAGSIIGTLIIAH